MSSLNTWGTADLGKPAKQPVRAFGNDCWLLVRSTLSNHLLLRTTKKNKQIQFLHEMIRNILRWKVKVPSMLPWQTNTWEIREMPKPTMFTQSSYTRRAVGAPCPGSHTRVVSPHIKAIHVSKTNATNAYRFLCLKHNSCSINAYW